MSKKILFFVITFYTCLTTYAAFAHTDGGLPHTHTGDDYEQIQASPETTEPQSEG
jgi:hypothetical protein